MKVFYLTIFLLSFTSFAGDSTVGRTPTGRLILNSGCSSIKKDLAAIVAWTKKLESRDCPNPEIKTSSEGMCVTDITDCVPEHVKKYQGLNAADNGPNCWNLALVMGGLEPMLRESSMEEWEFYLSSPLCRELASGEAPQSGDLGSVEARTKEDKGHIHGFMYVSPELVYSKNGTALQAPYSLQSLEAMEKVYRVGLLPGGECESDCGPQNLADYLSEANKKLFPNGIPGSEICYIQMSLPPVLKAACKELKDNIKQNEEGCKVCVPSSLHYYRCQKFDEYFSSKELENKEALTKIKQLIKNTESCSQSVLFAENAPGQLLETVTDNLKILNAYLEQQPKWSSQKKEDKFVLASLSLRLQELENLFREEKSTSEIAQLFKSAIDELK
jgi:hypothetical protein